jgi:heme-degrading monooxygenase HmoA
MSEPVNGQSGYIYVWDFIVSKSSVLEFEKCYGPNGKWADLFRKSAGYLKTELIRDKSDPLRYLTIDHWQSEKDHSEFLATFKAEYDELDRLFEELTVQETKIGTFTTIS